MNIGLIVGSGLDEPRPDDCIELVETGYGEAVVCQREVEGRAVVVLPRHGVGHGLPPHRINYRANIAALEQMGCQVVLATNAVGSLRSTMAVGEVVLPDQFLDLTRQRPLTFFDGDEGRVVHTDMTDPYCPALRALLHQHLQAACLPVHAAGTYLCAEGPRFETAAEIRMFAQWGADVVGMTGVPEVVLAREAGLCYAAVCVVTNLAAGLAPGPLSGSDIAHVATERFAALSQVLDAVIAAADPEQLRCCRPRE